MAVRKKKTTKKKAATKKVTAKPASGAIGATIDRYYKLREERLTLARKVEKLKEQESSLKEKCIAGLRKLKLASARGKVGTFSMRPEPIAVVDDWDEFYCYVADNEAWELMQRRLNHGAFVERWDNKEEIGGVRRETVLKTSLTKAGGRHG